MGFALLEAQEPRRVCVIPWLLAQEPKTDWVPMHGWRSITLSLYLGERHALGFPR